MMVWKTAAHSLAFLRALVSVLFVCSITGLMLTVVFSFEEPNTVLLLGSAGLLVTAVVSVFAHLALSRTLNGAQKRRWLGLLTGRRAVSAWAEYLSCDDLRAAASRLSEADSARR
jgi:hypothetical protein